MRYVPFRGRSHPGARLVLLVALASARLAAAQSDAPPPEDAAGAVLPTAEPRDLAVWLGRVESDNLARTTADEDGAYDSLGLLLDLARTSRRLNASVDANLDYRRYSLEALDNETVGTMNAAATVGLVRDRFSWTFSDNYGQGVIDPFSGIAPGNREKINLLASGPTVVLPAGSRTSIEIRGVYSERRYSESDNVDSDSVLSELGLYRQASPTTRFGILASSNDVEYVDVSATPYQIDRVGLRYEKELATGRVRADLGTNELSTAGFDSDEPLYNFLWTRSLTARSELTLRAARELTDSAGVLGAALAPGPEGASFTDVVVAPNPLEQRRVSVSYAVTMSRTFVSADIGASKDSYVGNTLLDNDLRTLRLVFVRTVSERLTYGVGHAKAERDFADESVTQGDGEDSWTGAWLNRTLGRRFSLGIAISKYDRTGLESYDEKRYEIRFGYSPTDSAAAAMGSLGR